MANQKQNQQRVEKVSITLEGVDLAILRQVEKDYGLSRSAAVRFLIRRAGRVERAGCQQAAR